MALVPGDRIVNKYSVQSEIFVICVKDQLLYLCPLIIYFTDTISMDFFSLPPKFITL